MRNLLQRHGDVNLILAAEFGRFWIRSIDRLRAAMAALRGLRVQSKNQSQVGLLELDRRKIFYEIIAIRNKVD